MKFPRESSSYCGNNMILLMDTDVSQVFFTGLVRHELVLLDRRVRCGFRYQPFSNSAPWQRLPLSMDINLDDNKLFFLALSST